MNFVKDDDIFTIDIFVSRQNGSTVVFVKDDLHKNENATDGNLEHYQFFLRYPDFSDIQQISQYATLLPVENDEEAKVALKICAFFRLLKYYKIVGQNCQTILPDKNMLFNLEPQLLRQIFLQLEPILDGK